MKLASPILLWKYIHALLMLVLAALVLMVDSLEAGISVVIGILFSFFLLFFIAKLYLLRKKCKERLFGPADFFTAARLLSVIMVWLGAKHGTGWESSITPLIILSLAELTDLIDGRIARRFGSGFLGAVFDEETDAVFVLVLSLSLVQIFDFPPIAALPGIMRYIFLFITIFLSQVDYWPAAYYRYSRFTCAYSVIALITAWTFFLPCFVRAFGVYSSIVLLLVSFLWEAKIRFLSSKPLFIKEEKPSSGA